MENKKSGLSSSERQQKAAADIARKKVLDALSETNSGGARSNLKQTPEKQTSIDNETWKKYHSAWQRYYQDYYNNYYSRAARNYVATEKLKQQRAIEDERKLLDESLIPSFQKKDTAASQTIAAETILSSKESNNQDEANHIANVLREKINAKAKDQKKKTRRLRRFIPLFAGIAVVLVFLFLQYNRLIFAPIAAYISPGNNSPNTITPVDPTVTQSISSDPKLIIPKINVDVPVHFGISNDDATMMSAMNNGVAQFSIPGANAMPGENGNLVITGHSAGDIYSSNQYKFIFSGLERLGEGDLVYINYNSTRYTYSVARTKTVEPSDVKALTENDGKPMLVLVTCTPLGTSRYRLLVFAEQVAPTPSSEPQQQQTSSPIVESMPANEPSFFESIWNFFTGR